MIAKTPQSEVENTVPLEDTNQSLGVNQALIRPQSGQTKAMHDHGQHIVSSNNLASENTQMNTESTFSQRLLNN